MPRAPGPGTRFVGLLFASLLLAACAAPIPSHLTRLWPVGRSEEPILGLSTEDGVLILATPDYSVGDLFSIQFPHGNSGLTDLGTIDHVNDDLAVVRPLTSVLLEGRIATEPPKPRETLYVAVRDTQDDPVMEAVDRWHDGHYGDFIDGAGFGPPDDAARDLAGAGVYILRKRRWQIVGLMAGITVTRPEESASDVGLGYIGLIEISRVLPDRIDYFQRDIKPLRPDFEFGVPLQPGDIVIPVEGDATTDEEPRPRRP